MIQEATRKINVPFVKKQETHSKKPIDISGVINEKAWIEFANATKRVLTKTVTQEVVKNL